MAPRSSSLCLWPGYTQSFTENQLSTLGLVFIVLLVIGIAIPNSFGVQKWKLMDSGQKQIATTASLMEGWLCRRITDLALPSPEESSLSKDLEQSSVQWWSSLPMWKFKWLSHHSFLSSRTLGVINSMFSIVGLFGERKLLIWEGVSSPMTKEILEGVTVSIRMRERTT